MATSFSSTAILQPKLNSLLLHGSSNGGVQRSSIVNVHSWSAAANYVTLQSSAVRFSVNSSAVATKRFAQKRERVVRCATIEEIEAEKSAIEKDVRARMDKTIETLRSNFNAIRTGRASTSMLDKIEVEYYGSPVSLKSLAQISTPDASSLMIQPYDKSSLKAIEKAIVSSDLGMTPNNDGDVIRLTLPQLTSDRRKELSKVVAKQAEEGKVALRNIRRDAIKAYEKLEKDKKLSEDIVKDLSGDLQKLTDEYIKKIDINYKQKEKHNPTFDEKQSDGNMHLETWIFVFVLCTALLLLNTNNVLRHMGVRLSRGKELVVVARQRTWAVCGDWAEEKAAGQRKRTTTARQWSCLAGRSWAGDHGGQWFLQ
ncbi:hypothetical protein ACFE04_031775 [Oxalis oulophora]